MNEQVPDRDGGAPQKMSTGSKVMLVLLAIFGGIVLLCCGGGLFIYSRIRTSVYETPAEVAAVRKQIMQIDVPDQFKPAGGADIDLFIYRMKMATYQRKEGVSQIAIVKIDVTFGQSEMKQAREQMRQQGAIPADLENAKSENRTYEIDGEKIDVSFTHGKLKKDSTVFKQPEGNGRGPQPVVVPEEYAGKDWYAVQMLVPQSDGMVLLMVTGPEDEFDEQEVDSMIESIHLNKPAAEK